MFRLLSARALRYAATGLVLNAAGYAIFAGLVALGAPPVLIVAALYPVAGTISYAVNRTWAFRSARANRIAAPGFILSHVIGYAVTTGATAALLRAGFSPYIAGVGAIFGAALVLFVLLNLVFGDSHV